MSRNALGELSNKALAGVKETGKAAASPAKVNKKGLFSSPLKSTRVPEPLLDENPDRWGRPPACRDMLIAMCRYRMLWSNAANAVNPAAFKYWILPPMLTMLHDHVATQVLHVPHHQQARVGVLQEG